MEEVRGRTLLDEDSIVEMPVVVQDGLICVPGQSKKLKNYFIFNTIIYFN